MEWTYRVGRSVVYLLGMVGAVLLLLLFTPLANLLAMPLYGTPATPRRADVIVVLSGWWNRDGSLNEAALTRTLTAAHLHRQGLAPYVLFTGGPCCGGSVSSAMADLAVQLGVPKSAIILDEESMRTHESAINSTRLLHQRDMQSILLVSSPLHLLRAGLAFKAAGIRVFPMHVSARDIWGISGAAARLSLVEQSIHEYVGLAFYRINGWI